MPAKKPAKKLVKKSATSPKSAKPAKSAKAAKAAKAAPASVEKKYGPRKDLGMSIDSYFDKHRGPLRAVLLVLRELIEKSAPDATSSIKWGMPFYQLDGEMFAALSTHKAHVNLIMAGPPTAFDDPAGRLSGGAKNMRGLRVTDVADIPRGAVKGWLKTAAHLARTR